MLAGTVLVLGDSKDALFGFVMVLNILIGVVQEWRAKATLDRLSLVSAPKVTVLRDGERQDVASEQVVLDDVFELHPGDQIVVDGEMLQSDGLTVDESLLTGESDAVEKQVGDELMSGSFVVAGGGLARATAVGADSYAQRLTAEAKKFQAQKSELARGIDRILQVVTWAIIPTAVILFFGQRASEDETVRDTLIGTVAGVVALVPQGLVLLLSMAQAVAVIRLGRKKVLVQQLQAVETLARVTVLATDKTGTLTDGEVTLERVEPLDDRRDGTDGREPARVGAGAGRHRRRRRVPQRHDEGRCSGLRHAAGLDRSPTASRSTRRTSTAPSTSVPTAPGTSAPPRSCCPTGPRRPPTVEELAAEGLRVLLLSRATSMPPAGTAARRPRRRPRSSSSPTRSGRTRPRPSTTSCARTCGRRSSRATTPSRWPPSPAAATCPTPSTTSTPARCRPTPRRWPTPPSPTPCSGG